MCLGKKKGRTSFLKKRSKKLLFHRLGRVLPAQGKAPQPKEQKFFGSFFQKRTLFLPANLEQPYSFCCAHPGAGAIEPLVKGSSDAAGGPALRRDHHGCRA
jgi:hypothetical protein